MPSRLKERSAIPIDSLDLGGGDFVRVRRWLTAQDRDEINGMLTEIDMEKGVGTYSKDKSNRVTVLQAMVEWGGPGFCVEDHPEREDGSGYEVPEGHTCTPVERTFETISILPDPDIRAIAAKITSKNPRPIPPGAKSPFHEATPAGVS